MQNFVAVCRTQIFIFRNLIFSVEYVIRRSARAAFFMENTIDESETQNELRALIANPLYVLK